MSTPLPYEEQLLLSARNLLRSEIPPNNNDDEYVLRLEILEAAASRLGGFSLSKYRHSFDCGYILDTRIAYSIAERLVEVLQKIPIHPALALSALARPPLSFSDQRKSGAYYTDFRLAQFLAATARPHLRDGAKIVDPASGTGILLVAAVLAGCGSDRLRISNWLRNGIYAADLSQQALRGARAALASLTDDVSAVVEMNRKWRQHDSLLVGRQAWEALAPSGFDLVLANPPWEKLKLSRHEFLRSNGDNRHYGAIYDEETLDNERYLSEKNSVTTYVKTIANNFTLIGTGEPDLYKPFLELFFRLIRPGGCVSVLIPAGLIRSHGTKQLRSFLLESTIELDISVIENRARFFSIDTRFKFLAVHAVTQDATKRNAKITLSHASGHSTALELNGVAKIEKSVLIKIRPDLTIPEVKSNAEWRIFKKMTSEGCNWGESNSYWRPTIVREIDMTRDSKNFVKKSTPNTLPLIEGRMIHQYRFGAKRYVTGTGRRAKWETTQLGNNHISPQFWYPSSLLSESLLKRIDSPRVGFCDITGQTNERSMLASLIPAGVVCGNKVPTITFPSATDDNLSKMFLWLAIANSIPFDWMLRRIITTTVNYFLLLSLPLPRLIENGLPARKLSTAAKKLSLYDQSGLLGNSYWSIAELRAAIDLGVLEAYGLGVKELEIILRDFPLLDRAQPPLPGEDRSTITRDFLMMLACQRFGVSESKWKQRVSKAKTLGGVPYIPSEFTAGIDESDEVSLNG